MCIAGYVLHVSFNKLLVCENNWIMRIAGLKGVDSRIMTDPREQIETQTCIVGRIDQKLAGHMVRMKDERPYKRETRGRTIIVRFLKTLRVHRIMHSVEMCGSIKYS